MNTGTCSYSKCNKTFTKRNYKHHACCASHRTLSNREKNGIANPYPTQLTVKGSEAKVNGGAVLTSMITDALKNNSVEKILSNAGTVVVTNVATPKVLDGVKRGTIKPVPAATGATISYMLSGLVTENALLRVLAALSGGYAFNELYKMLVVPASPEIANKGLQEKHEYLPAHTPSTLGDIINAREYRNLELAQIELDSYYSSLFGNPAANFQMMVFGNPGEGKTYWTAKFADYFNKNIGKVLYLAAEENGTNVHFQSIHKKIKSSFDIHMHPENLTPTELIKLASNYRLIVIDSVNVLNWSNIDIREIKNNVNAAILTVLQSNKDGEFKGVQNWLHDSDIAIQLVNRDPNVIKSRYGGNRDIEYGKLISM